MQHLCYKSQFLPHPAPTKSAACAVKKTDSFNQRKKKIPFLIIGKKEITIESFLFTWTSEEKSDCLLEILDIASLQKSNTILRPVWDQKLIKVMQKNESGSARFRLYEPMSLLSLSSSWIWPKALKFPPVSLELAVDSSLSVRPSRMRAPIPRDLR